MEATGKSTSVKKSLVNKRPGARGRNRGEMESEWARDSRTASRESGERSAGARAYRGTDHSQLHPLHEMHSPTQSNRCTCGESESERYVHQRETSIHTSHVWVGRATRPVSFAFTLSLHFLLLPLYIAVFLALALSLSHSFAPSGTACRANFHGADLRRRNYDVHSRARLSILPAERLMGWITEASSYVARC